VAVIGEETNECMDLVAKPEGKNPIRRPRYR